jgi:AAA+ superfamily predicted ATPase
MSENNYLKGEKFTISGDFLKKPENLSWDDVILDKSLKDTLLRIDNLITNDQGKMMSRGLLFLGPPGTGKTLSCKMLMKNANSTFIWITAKDMGWGVTDAISTGFSLARELSPAILCFEDVDSYIHRGECIDLFKTELDGLIANEGITTILTTNYPEQLPLAILDRPGRFHDICNFVLPNPNIRLEMINHLNKDEAIKPETLTEVIRETEGFSGAHLNELVLFAKRIKTEKNSSLDEAFLDSLTKLKEQKKLINHILEEDNNKRRLY